MANSFGGAGLGGHRGSADARGRDRAGARGGGSNRGDNRNQNRNRNTGGGNNRSNRSIATRSLEAGLSSTPAPGKGRSRRGAIGIDTGYNDQFSDFADDEDNRVNGLSRVPGAPGSNTGPQTEAEAYTAKELEQMGQARGYGTLTPGARRAIASARAPFAAFMHRFGSFVMPGVESTLTVDETGALAEEQEFDAVGLAAGLASLGHRNPMGGLAGTAIKGLAKSYSTLSGAKITNTQTRTLDEAAAQRGSRAGSGTSTSGRGVQGRQQGDNRPTQTATQQVSSLLGSLQQEDKPKLSPLATLGTVSSKALGSLGTLNLRRNTLNRIG